MEKKQTVKDDIEYFIKKEYDILLKKRGERFILYIPELCIIKEDENLAKAYEKLENEKVNFFQKIIDHNLQYEFRESKYIKPQETLFHNLVPFIIKFAIIIVVIVISVQVFVSKIEDKITPQNLLIEMKREVGNLNKKIAEMPDEKKEELRLKLRSFMQKIKPFVDEFKILLHDNPQESSKRPTQLKTGE